MRYVYNRPLGCEAKSERDIETRFLLTKLYELFSEQNEVSLLDVGFAGSGYIEMILGLSNVDYTGLDSNAVRISGDGLRMSRDGRNRWRNVLAKVRHIEADIVDYTSSVLYDIVMSISVIEHIVSNEYDPSYVFDLYRDIRAVNSMKKLVKKGGFLLLTFPCGQERILSSQESLAEKLKGTPLEGKYVKHRRILLIYNEERIDKIKGNWNIVAEQYWINEGHGFELADAARAFKVVHKTSDKDVKGLCTLMLQKV